MLDPTIDFDEWFIYCKMVPIPIRDYATILYEYGKQCKTITDCGTGQVNSAWIFGKALLDNDSKGKLLCIDKKGEDRVGVLLRASNYAKLHTIFLHGTTIFGAPEATDMVFFDTWRVYGQLKRELNSWNGMVKKYIIIHGTTKYADVGEDNYQNTDEIPVNERTGIWPAVEEFLAQHKEWVLEKRYEMSEGLTVLKRV